MKPSFESHLARLTRKIAVQDEAQREAEAQLAAGPLKFRVMLPGNPTREVGAASEQEAWEKYRRFFGIVRTDRKAEVIGEL